MTTIHLKTTINAPMQTVFDLSRNIDAHLASAKTTNEKAIAGRTSGLISLGETVTWKAIHFGFTFTHTSLITAYDAPNYFVDEMTKGHFKRLKHEHIFKPKNHATEMEDILIYEVPYGIFGTLFNLIFLKKYMKKFLTTRNNYLKRKAECLLKN